MLGLAMELDAFGCAIWPGLGHELRRHRLTFRDLPLPQLGVVANRFQHLH